MSSKRDSERHVHEGAVIDAFVAENEFYRSASVSRFSKFVTHLDLFRRISHMPGEIVECGVFKGASLFRWIKFRALLENTHSRKIFGFDVFGEFPEAEFELDRRRRDQFVKEAGASGPSVDELKEILSVQQLGENVELIAGDVRETVPQLVAQRPELRIALLNIDVDLYEPTLCCLETLFPHVVPGGVIVLDDYGAFAGANSAIEQFFNDRGEKFQKFPFAHSITFVVKGSDE